MTAAVTPAPRSVAADDAVEPVRPAKGERRRGGLGLNVALYIGLVVMAMPFVWMVLSSFKLTRELRRNPTGWVPEEPTLQNYRDLFDRLDFPRYFLNSTIAALAVTAGNLLFCSMLGYALAKLRFPGKRILLVGVLATMMIPAVVTFMPLFVIVTKMNINNTRLGLILPVLAGAFGAFLMRQFILGIPDELLDAARVDGAGEYRIFFRIVLPLCGPALATLAVLTFLGNWNSFLWPLVVASTEDMYTLAGGARPVLGRPAGVERRPADGRRRRGRAADRRAVLRDAALHHPRDRHDRFEVTLSEPGHAAGVAWEQAAAQRRAGTGIELPRLAAPGGVVARPGRGQVTLDWRAVDGAAGYLVRRADAFDGEYVAVGDRRAVGPPGPAPAAHRHHRDAGAAGVVHRRRRRRGRRSRPAEQRTAGGHAVGRR